jgi:hypothetical protein
MAWYWEYGKEEFLQTVLRPATTTHHQYVDDMEMDVNVSADRPPAEGTPKSMRFLCKNEMTSSKMPIESSPSSKRSIHKVFRWDTASLTVPNNLTGHACPSLHPQRSFGTTDYEADALCEPPAGAEEIPHDLLPAIINMDETDCWAPKRQRI